MFENINQLATFMTKVEDGASQMKQGDSKEFLGKLSDQFYKNPFKLFVILYKNGERRAKKAKKKV